MGCTSSAPNTIPSNANTADKSMQSEETNEHPSIEVDVADIEDDTRTTDTKVLPTCDTSEEHVQIVRNKKSSTSLATEKDLPANGHVIENENGFKALVINQDEGNKPKLELLIDKVFETNQHLNESENKSNESDDTSDLNNKVESEKNNIKDNDEAIELEPSNSNGTEIGNNTDEETKDASPTQSQSSRATRWEALADIAAELPPSLAVDPVTGQIYQMTAK